jgi:hypothetical protein
VHLAADQLFGLLHGKAVAVGERAAAAWLDRLVCVCVCVCVSLGVRCCLRVDGHHTATQPHTPAHTHAHNTHTQHTGRRGRRARAAHAGQQRL